MCVCFENYLKTKYILKKNCNVRECIVIGTLEIAMTYDQAFMQGYFQIGCQWTLSATLILLFGLQCLPSILFFVPLKLYCHVLKSANFFVHFKITLKANLDTIQIHQQRDRAKRALRKLNFLVLVLCISFQQQQQQNSKH